MNSTSQQIKVTQTTKFDKQGTASDIRMERMNLETEPNIDGNAKEIKMTSDKQDQSDTTSYECGDEMSISKSLAGIIDHIIGQLDTVTSTMIKIEKRLAIQEEYMAALKSNTLKKN